MRAWSTSTPSIRLDDTALSINACSHKTRSRYGDCLVNSTCLPRASPKSARYQAVVAGTISGFAANWRSVSIGSAAVGESQQSQVPPRSHPILSVSVGIFHRLFAFNMSRPVSIL